MSDDFVYVIRHPHGFVKIGKSNDPERRYKQIRRYSPYSLELAGSIRAIDDQADGSYLKTTEAELHHYYSRYRLKGEWFDLWPAEVEALVSLERVRAADIHNIRFELHAHPKPHTEYTIRDHLRDLWVLEEAGDLNEH